MSSWEEREAYRNGTRDGRAAAKESRTIEAQAAWSNLPLVESAYRRGYARGVRDIRRAQSVREAWTV